MKTLRNLALLSVACLALVWPLPAQQGPSSESSETVAKPRTKSTEAPPEQQKIPSKFDTKDKPDLPAGSATFKSDVTTVSVDVSVLDNQGHFIPNIGRPYFRVLEDNVPQQISSFGASEAPMTVCMVIEFSNKFQRYWTETWYQTLTAAYGFLSTLKPEDYVAIVAYDLRPEILTDFTTDKRQAYDAMRSLQMAGFSEANLYDAVTEMAKRMTDIEGRKAIVLLSSGIDTFSKITYDQTRKILQTAGVPVYAIGLMQALRDWYDAQGLMGPIQESDFQMADNQMRVFARETGGQSYFPHFYGEFPSIFHSIAESLRSQYSISYQPTNQARDGKFRKIKVELVDPATGQPLRIVDDRKKKPIKYQVIAKAGYTAPHPVE